MITASPTPPIQAPQPPATEASAHSTQPAPQLNTRPSPYPTGITRDAGPSDQLP